VTQLASCKSPAEAVEIQQRWLSETVERVAAETKAYQEQLVAMSRQGISALGQPVAVGAPRSHPKAA
jgi:hypothetical protein